LYYARVDDRELDRPQILAWRSLTERPGYDVELPAIPPSLVLVHSRDRAAAAAIVGQARRVVLYSGGGAPLVDSAGETVTDSSGALWIVPPVEAHNGVITDYTARDLLDWALDRASVLPSILRNRPLAQTLLAMCVMCEGYLAAHADIQDGVWGPPSIVHALEKIDWSEFMASARGRICYEAAVARRDAVADSSWWRAVFGDQSTVRGLIVQEWRGTDRVPACFDALLSEIHSGPAVTPETVAAVFTALADHISGQRSTGPAL
jgi:hypothetical protein